MATVMHTVRFVLGMAMLVGGVLLAQPFAAVVLAARGGGVTWPVEGVQGAVTSVSPAGQSGGSGIMSAVGGHAIPDGRPSLGAEGPGFAPANRHQAAVVTAEPIVPLPVSGIDLSPASPALDGTYRSTVDIPPPPLLDVHAPPPLSAGWSTHDIGRAAMPSPPATTVNLPAEYQVRDGDDLTGIAVRVYGHAAAANSIWTANRDRLSDPRVLPIGMPLRLPPSWALATVHPGHVSGVGEAIEPTFAVAADVRAPGVAAAATPEFPHAPGTGESFWLQSAPTNPSAARAIPAHAAGYPTSRQPTGTVATGGSRPAMVRVGLGDSLESIAVKYYGNKSMALTIWMANRERLRSPELLVPGVELRLP